jgi:Uma2 family endonuclease
MVPSAAKRMSRTPLGPYRFEDFCAMVHDGEKADLLDGVIYMASPDNTDAADLFVWLMTLLADYVQELDLGKVYGSRVAFRLSDTYSPEPDVAFLRRGREAIIERNYVDGAPDLAVEIVSPDSIERDYNIKRKAYEKAGVEEYWIVDEMDEAVYLLRLAKSGKYKQVRPQKGALISHVLPGFYLRPEWLWTRPLPKKTDILRELLASRR